MEDVLSRAVCMRCMAETSPVNGRVLRDTGRMERNLEPVSWSQADEEWWEAGKVLCPEGLRVMFHEEAAGRCPRSGAHGAALSGALVVVEDGL
jgi:hypothetical protein